jgi:hypothetical protein
MEGIWRADMGRRKRDVVNVLDHILPQALRDWLPVDSLIGLLTLIR